MLESLRKKLPIQRKLAIIPCPLCFEDSELKCSEDSGLWTRCANCKATVNEKGSLWLSWYVVSLYEQSTSLVPLVHQSIVQLDEFARSARPFRPLHGRGSFEVQRLEERTRKARINASRYVVKKE